MTAITNSPLDTLLKASQSASPTPPARAAGDAADSSFEHQLQQTRRDSTSPPSSTATASSSAPRRDSQQDRHRDAENETAAAAAASSQPAPPPVQTASNEASSDDSTSDAISGSTDSPAEASSADTSSKENPSQAGAKPQSTQRARSTTADADAAGKALVPSQVSAALNELPAKADVTAATQPGPKSNEADQTGASAKEIGPSVAGDAGQETGEASPSAEQFTSERPILLAASPIDASATQTAKASSEVSNDEPSQTAADPATPASQPDLPERSAETRRSDLARQGAARGSSTGAGEKPAGTSNAKSSDSVAAIPSQTDAPHNETSKLARGGAKSLSGERAARAVRGDASADDNGKTSEGAAATGGDGLPAALSATSSTPESSGEPLPTGSSAAGSARISATAPDASPAASAPGAPANSVQSVAQRLSRSVSGPRGEGGGPRQLSEAEQSRFVQRVARAFESAGANSGEMRIRLSPPELGSLRLEIKLQGGQLSARLEAETPAARQLLTDHLPALRERLATHQIKVEKFDVELMDRQPQGGSQWSAQQQQQRDAAATRLPPAGKSTASSALPTESPPHPRRPSGEGRLNVVI